MSSTRQTGNSDPEVAHNEWLRRPATDVPILEPPESERLLRQPSQSIIVTAIGRYKLLVLLLALLVGGAGAAAGIKRKPVWTANSTLAVGKIDPNSPGFSGFVQSATDLATTLSRAITANGVLSIIQKHVGLTPLQSTQRLTATPIPDGAAFSVIATGSTGRAAVNLANTAMYAMVAYEAKANPVGGSGSLYSEYQAQAAALARAKDTVQRLQAMPGNNVAGHPSNPALLQAEANVSDAQTRANALAAAYTQALESSPSGSLLAPLASAVTATSDRTHKIELYGFIGVVAGLLAGGAIAILLQQRRVRRIVAP